MRIKDYLLLCAVFPLCLHAQTYKEAQQIPLHQDWQFCQAGQTEWLPATVPGTVHQDLIDNHRLEDPFYGKNEEKVQWVEKEDWMYRTHFTLSHEQAQRQDALLCFKGLDTYADIYLNGSLLHRTDNMFVGYRLPVKGVLHEGENQLQVVFHSPIRQTLSQWQTDGFAYPADNDHSDTRVSVYSRKAPYSYGWDWGIRLATSGIWRPVDLLLYDGARIDDWQVYQKHVDSRLAQINNTLEIFNTDNIAQPAEIFVDWLYKGEKQVTIRHKQTLLPGKNIISLPFEIKNPHLWMPNGWGEQALYDVHVTVRMQDVEVARTSKRIGLRSINVVMEDDADGKSFYFVVNGKPLFAKGSNFIPDDALLPRITPERYRRLMQDVKDANHNMIRVWGGGIYEDEAFYDAADEKGILVWQDFIFACTTYPSDPNFLRRVGEEAEYNIKRLRNHPSLAMWCGNNEIYEGMRYWGWQKKYADSTIWLRMKEGYDKLFHRLLPNMVREYDPGRFYMHSSPYEANWGKPDSWKIGDSHNWGIWYGQKPFESLDQEIPRFMSEYGFQAFPEMKTISTFAGPEDYALESDVMNAHQKATIGNALIQKAMELYYDVPKDFEELVYKGLVLQGFGIRRGIEAHRRNRPFCMGTLYWQLNDSWPVVSWSGIDYYGNWKALHYQSQRAYAPLLVHAFRQDNTLSIYSLSDELEDYTNATLQLKLMDFKGKVLRRETIKTTLPANSSVVLHRIIYDEWAQDPSNTMLLLTLKDSKGNVLSEVPYYFCYPKEQNLPATNIRCKLQQQDGKCVLTLKADQLARDVFVEIPIQGARFSDNFFDLLPNVSKTITITSPQLSKEKPVELKIRHLKNSIHI